MHPQRLALHEANHDAPRWALPTSSCDCHTHVFGDPLAFPYAAQRQYTPGIATEEELLTLHRHLGIDRVVIVQPSPYGADNSCTLQSLRILGERARGVAVIDQHTTNTQLHEMHTLGVRGIRLNMETQGVSDPQFAIDELRWADQRLSEAKLSNWHIQIYSNLTMIVALEKEIQALQRPIVLDHFCKVEAALGTAQKHFDVLLNLVQSGKVWIKLSAPHRISTAPDFRDARAMARALIAANPARMLWGTDWPHPGAKPGEPRRVGVIEAFNPVNDGRALNRLIEWVNDEAQLRAILVANPALLYDFPR